MSASGPEGDVQIGHADLQLLYDSWRRKKGTRPFPTRAAVDPTELPLQILPHLMLLDLLHEGSRLRIRFRLTGTQVDDALGRNPTGGFADDSLFSNSAYQTYLEALYRELTEAQVPLYSENLFRLAGQSVPMLTRRLSLPLSSTGDEVDMALVGAVFEHPRQLREPRYSTMLEGFAETVRSRLPA